MWVWVEVIKSLRAFMLHCRGLKLERLTQSNQRCEKEDRGGWEGCENSVESSTVYLNCWGKLRDFFPLKIKWTKRNCEYASQRKTLGKLFWTSATQAIQWQYKLQYLVVRKMKLRLNDKMMAVNSRSESRQAYRLYFSTFLYRHRGFGIISVITAKLSNSAVWPGLLQPLI